MKNSFTLVLLLISSTAFCQSTDWPNLKRYAAANDNLHITSRDKKRVVFMGDSITELWKRADSAFFADHPYIDRGISGQTSPQMLLRFRQDVINLQPATVVILAGTNDIAENTGPITLENILGNIISMTELAKANHIRVILCSVLPAADFRWHPGLNPAEKIITLNTMIKDYAKRNKLTYVDYHSAMMDAEKGLDQKFTKDGVHPTLAGYEVMEPLVEKAIGHNK